MKILETIERSRPPEQKYPDPLDEDKPPEQQIKEFAEMFLYLAKQIRDDMEWAKLGVVKSIEVD